MFRHTDAVAFGVNDDSGERVVRLAGGVVLDRAWLRTRSLTSPEERADAEAWSSLPPATFMCGRGSDWRTWVKDSLGLGHEHHRGSRIGKAMNHTNRCCSFSANFRGIVAVLSVVGAAACAPKDTSEPGKGGTSQSSSPQQVSTAGLSAFWSSADESIHDAQKSLRSARQVARQIGGGGDRGRLRQGHRRRTSSRRARARSREPCGQGACHFHVEQYDCFDRGAHSGGCNEC